jgi:hypothetical protein
LALIRLADGPAIGEKPWNAQLKPSESAFRVVEPVHAWDLTTVAACVSPGVQVSEESHNSGWDTHVSTSKQFSWTSRVTLSRAASIEMGRTLTRCWKFRDCCSNLICWNMSKSASPMTSTSPVSETFTAWYS